MSNVNAGRFIGEFVWKAGASVPPGFLICDGAAVSREQYSQLFSEIGTNWGVGNGSTTFNLPPAGIVLVAVDGTTEFQKIGKTGGAKTITTGGGSFSVTSGPGSSHVHGAGSYSVTVSTFGTFFLSSTQPAAVPGTYAVTGISGTENSHTHTVSGTVSGGGTSSVLQPYGTALLCICYTTDL